MRVIVPCSQTGGVGKSTYAWNLAWCLARRYPGGKILFMDATKSQGTRSGRVFPEAEHENLGLGRVLNDIFSVMVDGVPFYKQADEISGAVERAKARLLASVRPVYGDFGKTMQIQVLPAASAFLSAVIETKWREPEEGFVMESLLKSIDSDFDFCVVDVTPDIGCKSVRSLLRVADAVVGIQSLKSKDTIQGIAQLLGVMEDTNASFTGIVANLFVPKRKQSKKALRILAEACKISGVPILGLMEDKGSVANCTEVHEVGTDIISGLYAELLTTTNNSERATLEEFERHLFTILDATLGERNPNITDQLWETYCEPFAKLEVTDDEGSHESTAASS